MATHRAPFSLPSTAAATFLLVALAAASMSTVFPAPAPVSSPPSPSPSRSAAAPSPQRQFSPPAPPMASPHFFGTSPSLLPPAGSPTALRPPSHVAAPPPPPPQTVSPAPAPVAAAEVTVRSGSSDGDGERESKGGMSAGKKVGIAAAVIVGVSLVTAAALVYKKRRENIRRSTYGGGYGR